MRSPTYRHRDDLRLTQEELATTRTTPGRDLNNYINELMRLCNLPSEMKEPLKSRLSTDAVFQGLTDECCDVKLVNWKNPDLYLPNTQSVRQSTNSTWTSICNSRREQSLGVAWAVMATATGTILHMNPSYNIFPSCGKGGHYRSSCAVPAKALDKSNKPAGQK